MKYRPGLSTLIIAFLVGGAVSAQPPGRSPIAGQAASGAAVGVPVTGEKGIQRTTVEIMAAQLVAPSSGRPVRMPEHEIKGREDLPQNPEAKPVASLPSSDVGAEHTRGNAVISAANLPAPSAPQAIGLSFDAVTGPTENGAFPPDTMGAVGPSQLFLFVNGRLRTFNKTTGLNNGFGLGLIEVYDLGH
jgi:hypothetical protein